MFNINYKSAFFKEEIEDRIAKNKGDVKDLEIQILSEFHDEPNKAAHEFLPKFVENDLITGKYTINALHTPLFGQTETNIDDVAHFPYFAKTCSLAQHIALLQKRDVIVIVHLRSDFSNILETVKERVNMVLELNPNIEVAIENSTPLNYYQTDILEFNDTFFIRNNEIHLRCVELAKEINNPRCGVCLDICHLQMLDKQLRSLYTFLNESDMNFNIYKEAAIDSQGLLKLIHLSYATDDGYGEKHGNAISDDIYSSSFVFLKQLREIYDEYCKDVPITIETEEIDYNDCKNCITTLNAIRKLG